MRTCFALLALGILVSLAPAAARAEVIFGLTNANGLITFDSATPGVVSAAIPIGGVGGPTILGIDIRPVDGQLVGVGADGNVYTINPATGGITSINSGMPLTGTFFGVDFNPVPNALRVVSDANLNLRIVNGGTGAINTDGTLNPGDPNVVGAAYSNNVPGGIGGQTTLYVIDSNTDQLLTQGGVNFPPGVPAVSPNTGTLFPVGPLGVNTSELVGFDISGLTGTAYASLTAPGAASSQLYTINVVSGNATLIGTIGGGQPLRGLTAAAVPEPGTLAMFACGLVGLLAHRWRRGRVD